MIAGTKRQTRRNSEGLKLIVCAICTLLPVLCSSVEGQQQKIPRIGYVDAGSRATTGHRADAFVQGLREIGYAEGQNFLIDYRWAEGKLERLPVFVKELIQS